MRDYLKRFFAPAMAKKPMPHVLWAMLGITLTLLWTDGVLLVLQWPFGVREGVHWDDVLLFAPFAATSFLVIIAPNSPLSQPFSVCVGNISALVCGVVCASFIGVPVLAATLSVAFSVWAMGRLRAQHPPSAALALHVVLALQGGASLLMIAVTVIGGSLAIVSFAVLFNRFTGRRYPFRQLVDAPDHEKERLSTLLQNLRLSANIGVGDLARILKTLEVQATAQHLGNIRAQDVMTARPNYLPPNATMDEIERFLKKHPHRGLLVADIRGLYHGIIPQRALFFA